MGRPSCMRETPKFDLHPVSFGVTDSMPVLLLEELYLLVIISSRAEVINREDFGQRGLLLGEISIVWIPLERGTLDLLHLLHPFDLHCVCDAPAEVSQQWYQSQEGSEEEGRPATASPHAGSATHGQVAAKAPCQGVAGCGQGQPKREASGACVHKHRPRAQSLVARRSQRGHLQGALKGLPPMANLVASKGGSANRRRDRPLAGLLPAGKGSRRLYRGSDSDAEGERVVRASFERKG
ncbi:hypothetical protein GW17_00053450 [Ensete ventricosum]|nr:hypothetical protein GW17_00053450 [Ensete ventricosum]